MRLPKTFRSVNQTVDRVCKKHGVRLYKYANVGNHLHMLIKVPHVRRWAPFIRELTGRIAQVAQGLKGPQKGIPKFWKQRPFTRIVRGWRRAFHTAKEYINLNFLEAEGFISRQETKTLKDLRAIFADW
jgi:REP element-mobilizing transposase RayT